MRKIPPNVIQQLENDPRMSRCCLCYKGGKLEWHHNLIHGGNQSDIPETILAVCSSCHDKARTIEVKEKLDLIMLTQMSDEQITSISKAVDYHQRLKYLAHKYEH